MRRLSGIASRGRVHRSPRPSATSACGTQGGVLKLPPEYLTSGTQRGYIALVECVGVRSNAPGSVLESAQPAKVPDPLHQVAGPSGQRVRRRASYRCNGGLPQTGCRSATVTLRSSPNRRRTAGHRRICEEPRGDEYQEAVGSDRANRADRWRGAESDSRRCRIALTVPASSWRPA